MKTTFTLLSLCLVYGFSFSQSLTWSNEVIVANGSTYGNVRPRIAVTNGNIPVVTWGGGMSSEPLYAARWNGTGFTMPMPVSPAGVDPAIMTWQGPDIAAAGNNVFVVFKREPEMTSNIYLRKSSDGGVTWSDTVRVDPMNGPYSRFPSLAVSSNGNPAVMFMSFDTNWMSATYVVTNSTDGGQTFPMPANASGVGGSDVCDCCPGYMSIDGANQAATWRRNNNNRRDMWAAVSTNSGATFPTGIDVDNTDWMISACPSSGPSPYLRNDSLFTVFMSGASGDERIYLSTFNTATQMEDYTTLLAGNYTSSVSQNYPFIAGSGDTLVVVWQQQNGGNLDTYFSWSLTGSAGLIDNEAMLNSSAGGQQQNPHVAYSSGTFHFVFTDLASGNVIYKSATIGPNGIAEATAPASLNVYPNPSGENCIVDLTPLQGRAATIVVRDISGRAVENFVVMGESRATITHQAAGTYFIEVSDNEQPARFVTRTVFY